MHGFLYPNKQIIPGHKRNTSFIYKIPEKLQEVLLNGLGLLTLDDIVKVDCCKESMDTDLLVSESRLNISQ